MDIKKIHDDQIQRVLFFNNWRHLHPKLCLCEYRDMYQLSDDLDAGAKLPEDFKFTWENEQIYGEPALSREEDLKKFQNHLAYRQVYDWLSLPSSSAKENPPPKRSNIDKVIDIAAAVPSTKNDELSSRCCLELVSKLLQRYINNRDEGLDRAFGFDKPPGRPVKPYKLPPDYSDILKHIVESGKSQTTALLEVTNDVDKSDRYRKQWAEHKWAALNEFFYNRYSKETFELNEKERAKIKKYWDIEPPKILNLSIDPPEDHHSND